MLANWAIAITFLVDAVLHLDPWAAMQVGFAWYWGKTPPGFGLGPTRGAHLILYEWIIGERE